MNGLTVVAMMVAIPALMLLGLKIYEYYRNRKRDQEIVQAQKDFFEHLRSLGVKDDPVAWLLAETRADKWMWRFDADLGRVVARLGSGYDEIVVGLVEYCRLDYSRVYIVDFRYANHMSSKRSFYSFIDVCEDSKTAIEGNPVVKELYMLVYGMKHVHDVMIEHEINQARARAEERKNTPQ